MRTTTKKPLFLWFLDHDLKKDELCCQIREFKAKGFAGFFMHWLHGGEPYMGKKWLASLDLIINEAKKNRLEAWLYDEAWCPSGFAGGRILAKQPELQLKTIWHKSQEVRAGEEICLDFELMEILGIVALPVHNGIPIPNEAVDLTKYVGTVMIDPKPPYRHKSGYYPHVKTLEHWRQGCAQRVWRLRWKPLSGNWCVYVFCIRRNYLFDNVNCLDVLSLESSRAFLAETHEVYKTHFGNSFGNVIPGIMMDEPKYCLPNPWTHLLPERFEKRWGINLIENLPLLIDERIPNASNIRTKYYRLVSDLFRENFIMPIAEWCRQNNLLLTGHISPEEDVSGETDYVGSIARCLEYFDIPGTDLIIQTVGDKDRPALNLGPRMASAVAHQFGKERVFVEVGACCDEDLSLEQLKYLCDWLMVNGCNLICFHSVSYSLDGYRKFYAGQTIACRNNLWLNIPLLTNYIEEMCEYLSEFRPRRRVALLKPHTTIRSLTGPVVNKKREVVDETMIEIAWELLKAHCDFDLLDEDTSDLWHSEKRQLTLGKAGYNLILIPECEYISEEAAEKISEWLSFGGNVLALKKKPQVVGKDGIGEWNANVELIERACEMACRSNQIVNPDIVISGDFSDNVLAYTGYNKKGEDICFLLNLASVCVDLSLEWKNTKNRVVLAPRESRLIKSSQELEKAFWHKSNKEQQIMINGQWSIKADMMNHVPLISNRTKVIVKKNAEVSLLVFDKENVGKVIKNLKVDGNLLTSEQLRNECFYDSNNVVLPVSEILSAGEHIIELNVNVKECPTILLAGRFAAFVEENDMCILTNEPEKVAAVDRIKSGYPYLRGTLSFSASFHLDMPISPEAVLYLPDRQGSITVNIDSQDIGTVAWQPNHLLIGPLSRGEHILTLKVIGDGIGILQTGACPAGISQSPCLSWIAQ